jgi:hypothetical protein
MMTTVATGLTMFGVGWHALVTLLFNELVASSLRRLSAEVCALRRCAYQQAHRLCGPAVIDPLEAGTLRQES